MNRNFETLLASPTAAYEEGLRFFRGIGMMNETLRRLTADLETVGIDYSVIGGIALNLHGYKRFTEDIDLLLNAEGLRTFQDELVARLPARVSQRHEKIPRNGAERPGKDYYNG